MTVISRSDGWRHRTSLADLLELDEVDRDVSVNRSDRTFASALWRPGGSAGIEGCRLTVPPERASALAARLLPSPR